MPRLNDLPDFLVKVWNSVHDPAAADVIYWNDDGTALVITSPEALQERVLTRSLFSTNFFELDHRAPLTWVCRFAPL